MFDIHNGSFSFCAISVDLCFSNSSIFGIHGLNFMQLSFNFPEFNANFSDLSLTTFITAGDTEHSFSTFCTFSKCPDSFRLFIPFSFVFGTVWIYLLVFSVEVPALVVF